MTVRRSQPDGKTPRGYRKATSDGTPGQQPLLTERAALIIMAALIIGLAAGVLANLAGAKSADAILTGGTGFAGAIVLLNALIA